MTDYSLQHQLLDDLVKLPGSNAEWQALALGVNRIQAFERDGFIAGIDVLDDLQVDCLQDDLARLAKPDAAMKELFYEYYANESADPDSVLFHALGAWRASKAFHDLLWSPKVGVVSHQLLGGGAVRFLHDQLFCKPAHHGGVVAWHQDYSYWTWTTPMAHLTCWIALDDVDADNGCLWYVPGSHRWPDLPVTGLTGDMEAVQSVLNESQRAQFEARVPVIMKRGQAAFHHPRTMHGSFANKSNRPRRATLINTMRDGVRSAVPKGDPHEIQKHYYAPPQGELMQGRFFPRLFDPRDHPIDAPLSQMTTGQL